MFVLKTCLTKSKSGGPIKGAQFKKVPLEVTKKMNFVIGNTLKKTLKNSNPNQNIIFYFLFNYSNVSCGGLVLPVPGSNFGPRPPHRVV